MRVSVTNAPGKPQLRVGMSVELSVETAHERGFPSFLTGWFGSSGAGRG
jgi:membrane fusion protein, multidrug efflux system